MDTYYFLLRPPRYLQYMKSWNIKYPNSIFKKSILHIKNVRKNLG